MGKYHVYLKMENWQITGSFQLRGATNMILSLSEAEKEKGVIATSSGNQGAPALSIASFIKAHKKYENKNVILIVSGKKISLDTI
jgi:threonine dehydratase